MVGSADRHDLAPALNNQRAAGSTRFSKNYSSCINRKRSCMWDNGRRSSASVLVRSNPNEAVQSVDLVGGPMCVSCDVPSRHVYNLFCRNCRNRHNKATQSGKLILLIRSLEGDGVDCPNGSWSRNRIADRNVLSSWTIQSNIRQGSIRHSVDEYRKRFTTFRRIHVNRCGYYRPSRTWRRRSTNGKRWRRLNRLYFVFLAWGKEEQGTQHDRGRCSHCVPE